MPALALLSDVPLELLLVSPRSLGILNNLAAEDVHELARYAISSSSAGYVPVEPDSADADLVEAYANALELELVPLTVPILVATSIAGVPYKQPWQPGVEGMACQSVDVTASMVGNLSAYTTTVPAGKLDQLTGLSCTFLGNTAGISLQIFIMLSGSAYHLVVPATVTSGAWLFWNGYRAMPAGSYVQALVSNAHVGDRVIIGAYATRCALVAA